ncbi:hypothetical protein [Opitutus sp. ER46]|uniref:hypothetical protein n=1 Tax=Opitutus sp. ER46 TaxID=2161864 RepID=UPI000D31DA5A|nr:hypothetical protein [Opitutus sp. ER46]PTX94251.1 hypothetical protein DB354_10825 [Opitutus sp. ER46]
MGYIITIVVLLIVLPLLFLVLSRRGMRGGGIGSPDHGVTPDRPYSDEPTPRPGPGVDRRIPPS